MHGSQIPGERLSVDAHRPSWRGVARDRTPRWRRDLRSGWSRRSVCARAWRPSARSSSPPGAANPLAAIAFVPRAERPFCVDGIQSVGAFPSTSSEPDRSAFRRQRQMASGLPASASPTFAARSCRAAAAGGGLEEHQDSARLRRSALRAARRRGQAGRGNAKLRHHLGLGEALALLDEGGIDRIAAHIAASLTEAEQALAAAGLDPGRSAALRAGSGPPPALRHRRGIRHSRRQGRGHTVAPAWTGAHFIRLLQWRSRAGRAGGSGARRTSVSMVGAAVAPDRRRNIGRVGIVTELWRVLTYPHHA